MKMKKVMTVLAVLCMLAGLFCIGRAVYSLFVSVPLEFIAFAIFAIGLTGLIGIICIIIGLAIFPVGGTRYALVIAFVIVALAPAAGAKDIVQMPEHGSLWRLAQECGQPGAAWTAIAVKNPWLKIKMVKGSPVAIVHPGQPIILPDGWWLSAEGDDDEEGDVQPALAGAIWADFCDMAKNYPMPTILLLFIIAAVIFARNVVNARHERRGAELAEPDRGK